MGNECNAFYWQLMVIYSTLCTGGNDLEQNSRALSMLPTFIISAELSIFYVMIYFARAYRINLFQ